MPTVSLLLAESSGGCGHFASIFSEALREVATDTHVFVTFDLNLPDLTSTTQSNQAWLLAGCFRRKASLGPLHVPGKSVCFACLRHWLAITQANQREPFEMPSSDDAMRAAELVRSAFEEPGRVQDEFGFAMKMVDTHSGEATLHSIVPLKNCKQCGSLREGRTMFDHCGTLTGIVRSVAVSKERVAGTFHATAQWLSPLPLPGARAMLAEQQAHGKGDTAEAAKIGCVAEALERYSAIYRGDEIVVNAKMKDFDAVDPRSILLYSDEQYRTRKSFNVNADERYFVGEPFDPDTPIGWTLAIDMKRGALKYVPAACSFMWYQGPRSEPEYARGDSIGCASGMSFASALSHALCEWVERDAMAIWWYNRINRPAAAVGSFESPELERIDRALSALGRKLTLLDVRTDIAIPTYVAIAPKLDGSQPLFAACAHVSPRTAAWKAASEIGQIIFSALYEQAMEPEYGRWIREAKLETQPHLVATHELEAPAEPLLEGPEQALQAVKNEIERAGLDVFMVDLSRPDVLLKTVRAIVPGLRHIWNRKAPGRLYDVPVRLGWRAEPLREGELNPILCML